MKESVPYRITFRNREEENEVLRKLDDVGLELDRVYNIIRCKTSIALTRALVALLK